MNKKRQALGSNLSGEGLNELKRRIAFVLLGIFIFRVGAHIPIPGLNLDRLADLFNQHRSGILGLFNMFSGGALRRLTVFALGIMPYISASIIMQLFSAIVPKLEELKKEGDTGRKKIAQYTRYVTLMLACFQSLGISKWLTYRGIVLFPGLGFYCLTTITLMTGTLLLMWLGEQMTERGVGNGISLIIFSGIVSRFPEAIQQILTQVRQGQMQFISLLALAAVIAAVTSFVVFIESGQRRITVHYARRQQGNRLMASRSTHLPFKINMAGVIPPIFAASIILLPATLSQWFGHSKGMAWLGELGLLLAPGQPLYLLCFSLAIVFFSFFYTALIFDPKETAENLKKSGAFIPGIRPGHQTSKYIDTIMSKLTLMGSLYLILVALLPEFFIVTWKIPFYFGGTSLLIVVVVIMEFVAQVQSHLVSHRYESLIKKTKFGSTVGITRR